VKEKELLHLLSGQALYNKHRRQTVMPRVGFEPGTAETKRLQTYDLDRAVADLRLRPRGRRDRLS
jgi:hypothetical protein